MGKKNKAEEGNENYEVWISALDGWRRIEEKGNGGVFTSKQRCLMLAEQASHNQDVVETMVIERRPIAVFNGEAIGAKHKLAVFEKKKEEAHGEVCGGGPEKDHVQEGSPQLGSSPAPGGA